MYIYFDAFTMSLKERILESSGIQIYLMFAALLHIMVPSRKTEV
jgi:hypothetical protein